MLKIRLQGTKEEIKDYKEHLENDEKYKLCEFSNLYSNQGTTKFFRAYAEVVKKED